VTYGVTGGGAGLFDQAFGYKRPAITLVIGQDNLKTGRLEKLGGGDGYLRVVVIGKGIVEEGKLAHRPRSDWGRSLLEPTCEGLPGKGRQSALFGDAQHAFGGDTKRTKTGRPVG